MRIGYMYNMEAFPPRGGNHRHAFEIAQRLVDAGQEVAVVDDPEMPRVEHFSSTQGNALSDFVQWIDLLYIRIDGRFMSQWPAVRKCMALVGNKPVVWEINAPANEALAFSWLGGRRLDRSEGKIRRLRRRLHAIRRQPAIYREELLRRKMASGVSAAICVSSALTRYANEALGISNVLTLPNGGPLITEEEIAVRRSKRKDGAFTVFYAGSAIYPWQGLDYLTEVIRLAAQLSPDIRFVLAVNQRTTDLPESPNVHIIEKLNHEELLDVICASDVCVALHPDYFWSPYGFHNSPMKLFDYMGCMCPVVTSNRGQMRELIRHGSDGLLCTDDPHEILAQIVSLRDHPDVAHEIGRQGWERVQKEFNWRANGLKTIALFEQLTDSQPRHVNAASLPG